jgi:flagellar hook-associated protein 3 FlgL
MSVGRVATFASADRMVAAALRSQSQMNTAQLQLASGLVSPDYGGLGARSRQVLDLQSAVARAQSYADAADAADRRVTTMSTALTAMADILTSFRAQLTAATGPDGAGNADVLRATVQGLMDDFAAKLNTQYAGQYVFGGGRTDVKPVDLDAPGYPPATATSPADTSYYQGDHEVTAVQVSEEQVIRYGITADNSAFEQALRAFSMIVNSTGSTIDTATLTAASNLVVSAVDGVTAVHSTLAAQAAAMERAAMSQADTRDLAKSMVDDLTAVDVAAVTAQLSGYEAQLQASYAALGKIQGLRLADYLR